MSLRKLLFGDQVVAAVTGDQSFFNFKNERDCYAVCILSGAGVLLRFLLAVGLQQEGINRVSSAGDSFAAVLLLQKQSFLAANFLGCYLMGLFRAYRLSLHPVLFTGLSTGLCGCITTFSSWMGIFAVALNRGDAYSTFASFALQLSASWSFYLLGGATKSVLQSFICAFRHETDSEVGAEESCAGGIDDDELFLTVTAQKQSDEEDGCSSIVTDGELQPPDKLSPVLQMEVSANAASGTPIDATDWWERIVLLMIFVIIYSALWCAVLIDASGTAPIQSIFVRVGLRSTALAPVGAYLRWRLSKSSILLLEPSLKLPTLVANWLGTTLFMLVLFAVPNSGEWGSAVATGVAGSLSTVSTFFTELQTLYNSSDDGNKGPAYAARYLVVTVAGAVVIVQIIFQSSRS